MGSSLRVSDLFAPSIVFFNRILNPHITHVVNMLCLGQNLCFICLEKPLSQLLPVRVCVCEGH